MITKIRLSRVGTKGKPRWRLVVQDKNVQRNGKVLEILGLYDPLVSPALIKINKERINWWKEHGAQLSEAAKKIIE